MNTYQVSIHPNHPMSRARYTLETLSALANTRWTNTGTYYLTEADANEAMRQLSARISDPVRVAAIVNTHPLSH